MLHLNVILKYRLMKNLILLNISLFIYFVMVQVQTLLFIIV